MRLIESLKNKKFILFNIFLTLYIGINLIGGERGLISFYKKQKIHDNLVLSEKKLSIELFELEKKNNMLSTNVNEDFLDMIYREKLKLGKNDEIIIKIK